MEGTGEWLRDMRISAKMTQDELAGKLHVTRQTISSWEKGRTSINSENLSRIKSIFGNAEEDYVYCSENTGMGYSRFQKRYVISCAVFGVLLLAALVAYVIVRCKLGNASELHGLGILGKLFWCKLILGSGMSLLLGFLIPNLIAVHRRLCLPNKFRIAALLLNACVFLLMFWLVAGHYFEIMLPPIGSELWRFFRLLLRHFRFLRFTLPFLFGVLSFLAFNKDAPIEK